MASKFNQPLFSPGGSMALAPGKIKVAKSQMRSYSRNQNFEAPTINFPVITQQNVLKNAKNTFADTKVSFASKPKRTTVSQLDR